MNVMVLCRVLASTTVFVGVIDIPGGVVHMMFTLDRLCAVL